MTLKNDIKNGVLETIREYGRKLWGDDRVTWGIAGAFYNWGDKHMGIVLLAMDQIRETSDFKGKPSGKKQLVGCFRAQMRRQGMWLTDENIEKAKKIKRDFEDKYYYDKPITIGQVFKRSQEE